MAKHAIFACEPTRLSKNLLADKKKTVAAYAFWHRKVPASIQTDTYKYKQTDTDKGIRWQNLHNIKTTI